MCTDATVIFLPPPHPNTLMLSSQSVGKLDAVQSHLTQILPLKLRGVRWDHVDKDKNRALSRSIAELTKSKLLEIEPRGFKYIVQVQLVENLGQGGRADLACHWEDSDTVIQDIYSTDSLICTVVCFAIRT